MKMKALLLLAALFVSAGAVAQTPVDLNGALTVKGNQIVNKNGVPPQLRGISLSWSLWAGKKYYNPAVIDWLTSDFKATIIRASMGVQPDSGYLQQPAAQKQLITDVVDEAIRQGVYVLIDWHDHNGHLHIPQSKAFFAEMAQKYKGVPNVIYEIWNEPARISWDTVKDYALQVVAEIRKYDPDNLIVVGSPKWDQDVDVAAANPITGFKNIAYSFHFYASDPNHQDRLRAKADKAIAMGLPLVVTEWGVGESDGNGRFDMAMNKKWMDWVEKNRLSWVNWNITDKRETTAILQPHAPSTGNWTAGQLTPAGVYIRERLRMLNK
ncbi:glycoside hydrolase family 5 protein [Mucilaginibacter sp. 14171R-50]|uniref:glycoside hydrolase family 5 protein n=1 Tax=Mucilaginibacter sp. 14171R-50 TaxID=2703789 RepID=UPI00138BF977|nr:glycoside hydrolase family 5 protein [Mucilaginibacter sp. 14171R-50]QHS56219.1 glycoside hydrolase family 5 protein [Mucilaginibacter sp. 14171R-50]